MKLGLPFQSNIFTDRTKALLLLWIMLFLSCICYAFVCVSLPSFLYQQIFFKSTFSIFPHLNALVTISNLV